MKHITLRFRAPKSLESDAPTVTKLQVLLDKTRFAFAPLQIQVKFPEDAPQFTISGTDVGLYPPGKPDPQRKMVDRFRRTYGEGVSEHDFMVYFVKMPTNDGFTLPHGFVISGEPDIFIDIDNVSDWILAHELGHLLGLRKTKTGIDRTGQSDAHLGMFHWPRNITGTPPPDFPNPAKSDYQNSPHCLS